MLKNMIPFIVMLITGISGLTYLITKTKPNPVTAGFFMLFLWLVITAIAFVPLFLITRQKMEHPRQHYKNSLRRSMVIATGAVVLLILHLTNNLAPLQALLVIASLSLLELGLTKRD